MPALPQRVASCLLCNFSRRLHKVSAACGDGCRSHPPELDAWTDAYVERRYGCAAPSRAAAAWRVLARTLYSCGDAHNDHAADVPTSRPGLSHAEAGQWSLNPRLWYDPVQVCGTRGYSLLALHGMGSVASRVPHQRGIMIGVKDSV